MNYSGSYEETEMGATGSSSTGAFGVTNYGNGGGTQTNQIAAGGTVNLDDTFDSFEQLLGPNFLANFHADPNLPQVVVSLV